MNGRGSVLEWKRGSTSDPLYDPTGEEVGDGYQSQLKSMIFVHNDLILRLCEEFEKVYNRTRLWPSRYLVVSSSVSMHQILPL